MKLKKNHEIKKKSIQVSAIIGNLRNVANDINNTVKAQNESIDRINKKVNKLKLYNTNYQY